MALPPSEFWEMTPREFWYACRGYNERVTREYQLSWEQARWMGTITANSFSSKKFQPRDLVTFPWENETVDRTEELKLLKERRKWLQER